MMPTRSSFANAIHGALAARFPGEGAQSGNRERPPYSETNLPSHGLFYSVCQIKGVPEETLKCEPTSGMDSGMTSFIRRVTRQLH